MFGVSHWLWIGISILLVIAATMYLAKKKLPLEKVLSAACGVCVVSELIKLFSMLEAVPSSDGSRMYLYLEASQLPLHLCSIQILLIFFVRFTRNEKMREYMLAFMYPTCVLGAILALFMPTFINGMSALEIFTNPRAYQYFIFHSMLIVLGLYIARSGCVRFQKKHLLSSIVILISLGFITIYLNSMFATPVYEAGELVSVEYMPNFFFTQAIPIHFPLTEKWHWFAWWGVSFTLAVSLISLSYMPLLVKGKKRSHPSDPA